MLHFQPGTVAALQADVGRRIDKSMGKAERALGGEFGAVSSLLPALLFRVSYGTLVVVAPSLYKDCPGI